MIGGTAAKSDAVYTGDLNAVCGITSSIAWNGNWAFNCDFNNHDLSNAKVVINVRANAQQPMDVHTLLGLLFRHCIYLSFIPFYLKKLLNFEALDQQ